MSSASAEDINPDADSTKISAKAKPPTDPELEAVLDSSGDPVQLYIAHAIEDSPSPMAWNEAIQKHELKHAYACFKHKKRTLLYLTLPDL